MAKFNSAEIWRHNGRKGTVKIFQGGLEDILRSSVPTAESKAIAKELQPLVEKLYTSLGKRSDHPTEVSSAKVTERNPLSESSTGLEGLSAVPSPSSPEEGGAS